MYGIHNYNQHHIVLMGYAVAVEMHAMPSARDTWESHTVSGYYLGVSKEHYRCHKVWVKDTRSVRVGNTVFFKHKYLTIPTLTNADALVNAANDLKLALEGGIPQTDGKKRPRQIRRNIQRKCESVSRRDSSISKGTQEQRVHRAAAKYR